MKNKFRVLKKVSLLGVLLFVVSCSSSDDNGADVNPNTVGEEVTVEEVEKEEEREETEESMGTPIIGEESPKEEPPVNGDECKAGIPLFVEEEGLVIGEIETAKLSDDWEFKNDIEGASGSGYVVWKGRSFGGNPGNAVLTYSIKINTPGTYEFIWRSRITEGRSNSENNDSWLRFKDADDFFGRREQGGSVSIVYPKGSGKTPNPNGQSADGWFKIYMNTVGSWEWISGTSDNNFHKVFVTFSEAKTYSMEISPRSPSHGLDKFTLFLEGKKNIKDNAPLSEVKCN